MVKAQEIDYSAVKNVSTLLIPEAAFDSIDAREYIDCSVVPLNKDLDEKKAWALIHQESSRFNPYTNKALQSNYGDFWLRFSICNPRSKPCPLFCEIPHLKQVWTVDLKKRPRFRPLLHSAQKIWLPTFNSGFYLKLTPGQQLIFLVRCSGPNIEKRITPIIWDLEAYNQLNYAKATQYILVKSLIIGAFAVIFCFSLILFISFQRAVYGWYAMFQFFLLFYLWSDFTWHSPISDFALSDESWYSAKIMVAILTYCFYLKFIQKFLDEKGDLNWLNKFIRLFIPILIAYSTIDWGLQKTGWVGSTMTGLFYVRPLACLPGLWLIYKIWQITGIAANYARWAMLVLLPTIATSLVLSFTLHERYNWFGLDYTLFPLYLGLLGESSIFLIAVSNQESIWIRERTQALSQTNERKKKQLELEQKMIQKKEEDLLQIKHELNKIYSHRAEISLQKFEQEKIESELLQENAALRSRFTPELLLRIQARILSDITNLEKEAAIEKLRSFAVLMRDSLYFLRQKQIGLADECKLCSQLCTLFDIELSIPSFSSNLKAMPIPPLFILNLVQQAIMNQASVFRLQIHENNDGCQVIIKNLNVDDPFIKNYQHQLANFNEHYLLTHSIEQLGPDGVVINFQALLIE